MPANLCEGSLQQRVQALRQQLDGGQAARVCTDQLISSGCAALDGLLPTRGFVPGTLVEWLTDRCGSGAGTLAMIVARQACRQQSEQPQQQKALVVMDRLKRFYPPAAVAWGIDPQKLIVLRAPNVQDELWALDQALRCRGVAAVWAFLDRLDVRAFRRLQLAAETGGALGLLMRPAHVRGQPTWSDAQLLVQPQTQATQLKQAHSKQISDSQIGRGFNVSLLRCRGHSGRGTIEGANVEVEIDEQGKLKEVKRRRHETGSLHLASRLAHPTAHRRSARA